MNHLEMRQILVWNLFDFTIFLAAIYWIDVCPSDGNLVATGDEQGTIKIYDKRGKTQNTKTFHKVHRRKNHCCVSINAKNNVAYESFLFLLQLSFWNSIHQWWLTCLSNNLDQVYCVRWHSTGSVVASCSTESTAKIIDFKTGKVLENVKSRHRGKFFEISVLIDLDVEGLPSVCFLQPNA